MTATFTKQKLIENISQKHCSIKLGFSEDEDKDLERIHTWTKRLIKEHCLFKLKRARNEGIPYTEKETGLTIEDMETKEETGRKQVLDYHVYICLNPEEPKDKQIWIQLTFGIERKTKTDWHGTLYVGKNHKRFNREIKTAKKDKIIKVTYCFIECPYEEWITFYPSVNRYSGDQVRKMIYSKDNAYASILSKNVHVCWFPSRKKSASFIKTLAFQYAVETYSEWLDL